MKWKKINESYGSNKGMSFDDYCEKYGINGKEVMRHLGFGYNYNFNVTFDVLLCDAPFWKFNKIYNDWYEKVDEGAMGDFMQYEVSPEWIEEFMETGDIQF